MRCVGANRLGHEFTCGPGESSLAASPVLRQALFFTAIKLTKSDVLGNASHPLTFPPLPKFLQWRFVVCQHRTPPAEVQRGHMLAQN